MFPPPPKSGSRVLVPSGLKFAKLCLNRPQGKLSEAVPLLERALAIYMKKLGESHEWTVDTQESLVLLKTFTSATT